MAVITGEHHHIFLYFVFCLYLSAVFSLVGIPNVTYFRPELNLNLVPFLGIVSDLKNSILNVLLFIPLGFFLALLWEKYQKVLSAVCFGLGLSLAVELLQMLTFRATDVNDLITNVAGTVAGYFLAMKAVGRYGFISRSRGAAYGLCALTFGIMFFIHPILSPVIWDKIL